MASDKHSAVVEPQPISSKQSDVTRHSQELRIRQQEILANLGVSALKGVPFSSLIEEAVSVTAEGLECEFCKIMEYIPAENAFIVRAGVGWDPKMIGTAKLGADLNSPAGYALQTGKPVISNHLEYEERFRTPELLLTHGIHRAINVILEGERSAYGVLEVDSRSAGEFTSHDLTFLQGAANILGMAIERQRIEHDLKSALDQHKVLLTELNHRVKNSLQLVVTTLRLQEGATTDPDARSALSEASTRVVAIARAHENLYRGGSVERIDLGEYLSDICEDIRQTASPCKIDVTAVTGIFVKLDKAIPIALIVNELVTNAFKHAYTQPPPAFLASATVQGHE
jgi:two-component sensor histidine kinase